MQNMIQEDPYTVTYTDSRETPSFNHGPLNCLYQQHLMNERY